MSEIDFWEALAEGGNPIAKRNLEEFETDERRTKHKAQCTKYKVHCTLHAARYTMHTKH